MPLPGCRRRHGGALLPLARPPGPVRALDRADRRVARARRCTTSTRCCRTCRGSSRPQLRRYDRSVLGPITGLNSSERSVFDRTLVRQSWQRHLLQVGAVDALLGRIIERMKATGIYDRAALVVMADHGVSFHVGATDRRTILPLNAFDVAPIPLFMKAPGQRRGRIDRSMVRTYDVLPTLARQIGLRLPPGLAGRSAASAPVRRRGPGQGHVARAAGPDHVQPRPPGPGPPRRGAAQAGAVRVGRAQPVRRRPQRAAAGPARGAACACVAAPRVRATLNGARDYRRIYRCSQLHSRPRDRPHHRSPAGARRDIAVAVNGRIWAVTRSVRIRGSRSEYYSAIAQPGQAGGGAQPQHHRASTRSAARAAGTCSAACAKVFRPLATGVTGGIDHRGARGSGSSAARLGSPYVRPRRGAVSP